ncbi:hypothetical protein SAMN05192588_2275 [Nonlabens sp. Hel1_33_55]|uniref:hypothetical protein n=1 Tax=Nonlabens sp. Hel1_33_55 TaxID=1336802 RepID=UPI000875BED7|nr:hypothetical protein [Nonlabens sp. Hel1_33_55]SCY32662.1 hypothetical protein SAMN05192588_2275 [Nonlabens sp. Hel1_33_55]
MKKWVFRISIAFNIIFILLWFWSYLNSPSRELGRLEKEIAIGHFQSEDPIFTLPKGLTVRNVSERGLNAIGQFENNRFSIIITADDPSLINYDLPKDSLNMFSNFYSAEILRNTFWKDDSDK